MISAPQSNKANDSIEEVRLAGVKRDRKGNPITSTSNPTSTNTNTNTDTTTSSQPSQCSK